MHTKPPLFLSHTTDMIIAFEGVEKEYALSVDTGSLGRHRVHKWGGPEASSTSTGFRGKGFLGGGEKKKKKRQDDENRSLGGGRALGGTIRLFSLHTKLKGNMSEE